MWVRGWTFGTAAHPFGSAVTDPDTDLLSSYPQEALRPHGRVPSRCPPDRAPRLLDGVAGPRTELVLSDHDRDD